MNVVMTSLLVIAAAKYNLSVSEVVGILWAWWLLLLPINTWRDFLAGMSYYRLERMGRGDWLADPDPAERCNEPDADRVVKYCLWLPGAAKNFITAKIATVFYYHTWLKWSDVGLTKLTNRMAEEGTPKQKAKAMSLRRRWLDRYDPRGKHT